MASKNKEGDYEISTVTGSSAKYRVFKNGRWSGWTTIQGTTLDAERAAAKKGANTRFR